MKLEQQVTSVEISNKIRKLFDELGVQKPSIYYRDSTKSKEDEIEIWGKEPDWCEDNIPCYSVAELGELLPVNVETYKNGNNRFTCLSVKGSTSQQDKTEADARAKMLIYLLENKLI